MHIGFRYHVATLVAVFFSLFLGIIVGSILFQDDLLVQEQNSIINELEQRFKQLELSTKEMQANLKQIETRDQLLIEGWDLVRAALIHEKLLNHQVMFFHNGEQLAPIKRLTKLVEDAGAEVYGSFVWPNAPEKLQNFFEDINSEKFDKPTAVVWVDKPLSETVKQGLEYLHQLGCKLCIVQPYSADVNLAEFAENALIIDLGDTFIGELAVIRGLSAGLTGIYGHSSAAVGLIPQIDME